MNTFKEIPLQVKLLLGSNILSHIGNGVAMISLPWIIVKHSGGETTYAAAVIMVNIISMFLLSYIGVIIDKYPRKWVLISSEFAGFIINSLFAIIFLWLDPDAYNIAFIILLGGLLHGFHYPARFAFAQELVSIEHYNKVNSWLEIQGQTAFVIAGGIGGYMADRYGLEIILAFDAFTYLAGIFLLLMIKYTPQKVEFSNTDGKRDRFRQGYTYLKERPHFTVFFLAAAMPFVGTMAIHYIMPIHLSNTLQTDATILGVEEILWAIGAVSVSTLFPFLSKKYSTYQLLLFTFSLFTLGNIFIGTNSAIVAVLISAVILGFGNSGSRVARNTLLMNETDNHIMGRVASIIMAFNKMMQVIIIGASALIVKYLDTYTAFIFIGIVMSIALYAAYSKRFIFKKEAQKTEVQLVN